MIVFRVESPDGRGPYSGSFLSTVWQTSPHNRFTGRPLPGDDGICRKVRACYEFGFQSEEDLYSWFHIEEINNLSKLGYIVAKYDVPLSSVIFGWRQVVFDKREATLKM